MERQWTIAHEHNGAVVNVKPAPIGNGAIRLLVTSPDENEVTLMPEDADRIIDAIRSAQMETISTISKP